MTVAIFGQELSGPDEAQQDFCLTTNAGNNEP